MSVVHDSMSMSNMAYDFLLLLTVELLQYCIATARTVRCCSCWTLPPVHASLCCGRSLPAERRELAATTHIISIHQASALQPLSTSSLEASTQVGMTLSTLPEWPHLSTYLLVGALLLIATACGYLARFARQRKNEQGGFSRSINAIFVTVAAASALSAALIAAHSPSFHSLH